MEKNNNRNSGFSEIKEQYSIEVPSRLNVFDKGNKQVFLLRAEIMHKIFAKCQKALNADLNSIEEPVEEFIAFLDKFDFEEMNQKKFDLVYRFYIFAFFTDLDFDQYFEEDENGLDSGKQDVRLNFDKFFKECRNLLGILLSEFVNRCQYLKKDLKISDLYEQFANERNSSFIDNAANNLEKKTFDQPSIYKKVLIAEMIDLLEQFNSEI